MKGEHRQRQRHLGGSRVDRTSQLSCVRRGSKGPRVMTMRPKGSRAPCNQMPGLYRNQRSWGKGKPGPVPGLEKFR